MQHAAGPMMYGMMPGGVLDRRPIAVACRLACLLAEEGSMQARNCGLTC